MMMFGRFYWIIPFLFFGFFLFLRWRRIEDQNPQPRLPKGKELDYFLYKLAETKKGRITVSDVVLETGMNAKKAGKILDKMVTNGGGTVNLAVNEKGIVFYEFPEIMERLADSQE